MFKLYLKKLFLMIVFAFVILVVYFLGFSILETISNFFQHPAIRYTILIGVPAIIVLSLVNKGRIKNKSLRTDYMNHRRGLGVTDQKINIKSEIIFFKTFKPLHAEALAVVTLLFPFVIAIGFSTENEASFFVNLFVGILVFSLLVCIYLIADIALWMLVHKSWMK